MAQSSQRPHAAAEDRLSLYRHGNHRLLVIADGKGAQDVAAVHLPLSAGGSRSASTTAREGDPFTDPRRPLRLALASDVAGLPSPDRRILTGLARLHGVEVYAFPGSIPAGSPAVHDVTVTQQGDALTVTTSARPNRTYFDHVDANAALLLASRLGLDPAKAHDLVCDFAAHRALGCDYLVSPTLASGRTTRSFWGASVGTARAEEAAFLAGVKSRMYRMTIVNGLGVGAVSVNAGWVGDSIALALAPAFRRALAGCLSPKAGDDEVKAGPHLFAIRGLLRDLLFARDELVRLERREALGSDWASSKSVSVEIEGGSGNDLTYRVSYHTTAALNAFTAILDNLAGVVDAREGLGTDEHQVRFGQLVGEGRSELSKARPSHALRTAPARSAVRRALALRALRNHADHRSGLDYGQVRSVTELRSGDGPQMLAVWVWRADATFDPGNHQRQSAAAELEDVAVVALPDVVLLRARTLTEVAIACAARLADDIVSFYDWSSTAWLEEAASADPVAPLVDRSMRGRWQRGLWGATLIHPALRRLPRTDQDA